jgi:hypothetical protein
MTQESILPTEKEIKYNKSVLKSAVQKAVRLGLPEQAVRLAKAGMQKDLVDFMRRLMIIVPEDCIIHPEYPRLAKITDAVSRGNQISDEDRDVVLQVVYDIAQTEWRDTEVKNPDEVVVEGEYEYLTDLAKSYVDALRYRAGIGGMKWDIIFLNQYVKIWTHRFANGFKPTQLKEYFQSEVKIVYDLVPEMKPEDIPLVAIDIHCFPPIKRLLLKKDWVQELVKEYDDIRQEYFAGKDDDGFMHEMMWLSYISKNLKNVYWYEPPAQLNRIKDQMGATPEVEQRLYQFADKLMPEIESIAKWFIKKQSEKE